MITVALPLGIGDCHWAVQKLRALKQLTGQPLRVIVNRSFAHETWKYLELVPFIDRAELDPAAPGNINAEMNPPYRHECWSSLEQCRRWKTGVDYLLVPNGHLERGERIESFLPELETDYTYPLQIHQLDRRSARELAPPDSILLYLSGTGPNVGFHNESWTRFDWIQVIRMLNDEGIDPILLGGNSDDEAYYKRFLRDGGRDVRHRCLIGRTTHAQVIQMILDAACWCGLNSGLGIVAAAMSTPTVMLWSDSDYPISGVKTQLHPNMQTAFLCDDQLGTYRTLSFGSPGLTPASVVRKIIEVRR